MLFIHAYDSNGWSAFWNDMVGGTTLVVSSVSDLVSQVLSITDGQQYKSRLYLMGEGSDNYQSVGAGSSRDMSGNMSLTLAGSGDLKGDGGRLLSRIADRISSIHLMGVEGMNNRSFNLEWAVARALGPVARVHTQNGLLVYHGEPSTPVRHFTSRAELQTGALRDRLGELAGE